MGYITDKDKMRYKSLKDLEPVELVFDESDKAIRIKTRTLDDSDISKILCATSSAAGAGFAASIGIGMLGIGALAVCAPVAILGGMVALCCGASQAKKLEQAKEICYTTALRKQNAIIEELRKERYADKKRIEYLTAVNNSLNGIIADLTHDLGY